MCVYLTIGVEQIPHLAELRLLHPWGTELCELVRGPKSLPTLLPLEDTPLNALRAKVGQ